MERSEIRERWYGLLKSSRIPLRCLRATWGDAPSLRHIDLDRRGDLFPGRDLAGEPGVGLVHGLRRHDVEVLLAQRLLRGRRLQRLDGGLVQGFEYRLGRRGG